ncbi:MAG: hypothetical protein GX146_10290 [Myxococcales bacterium]|nr:hypothetical protein [Myxococcales bacterium]
MPPVATNEMSDSDKSSRWAKILADAGLIDEVDDVWELPPGDIRGATIEVMHSEAPKSPVTDPSLTPSPSTPNDAAQPVIVIESTKPRKGRTEDITREIATKNAAEPPREAEAFRSEALKVRSVRATVSGIPLLRQTPTPLVAPPNMGFPPRPAKRTQTDPAPFALQSRAPAPIAADDDAYIRPTREIDIADERPTVEIETSDPAYRAIREEDDTRQTPLHNYDDTAALQEALTTLQEQQDQKRHDHTVDVCGARISIASIPPPAPDLNAIIDLPADYRGDDAPLELIPEADDDDRDIAISLPPPSPREQLKAKYNLGDFSGALDLANEILKDDPDNIEMLNYRETCRETLLRMYESRIGDMTRIPKLLVPANELMWRNLDPTTGFVLSRFDGMSSFEDVIDISGLPRFETCRIIAKLIQDGIVG